MSKRTVISMHRDMKMRKSVCNRCHHIDNEDEFEGMDVLINYQGGRGESSYLLCDPCVEELRKWLKHNPKAAVSEEEGHVETDQ